MKEEVAKEVLYGGVAAIMDNPKFFYKSPIGNEYSILTKEGEVAIAELFALMIPVIADAREEMLRTKAKEMLMDDLRGDVN